MEAENQYEELLSFSPPVNPRDTTFDVKKDTITPASMVTTPEKFDGRKPNPRRWIDFYVKSISLNGWTNRIAVKYFSSYLEGTAFSWFNNPISAEVEVSSTFPSWYEPSILEEIIESIKRKEQQFQLKHRVTSYRWNTLWDERIHSPLYAAYNFIEFARKFDETLDFHV